MAKKGFHGHSKKADSSGPILATGGGVAQSSIPRAGHPPGGRTSATRYSQNVDSHSVDHKGGPSGGRGK
jgi:hypothetical protein